MQVYSSMDKVETTSELSNANDFYFHQYDMKSPNYWEIIKLTYSLFFLGGVGGEKTDRKLAS